MTKFKSLRTIMEENLDMDSIIVLHRAMESRIDRTLIHESLVEMGIVPERYDRDHCIKMLREILKKQGFTINK